MRVTIGERLGLTRPAALRDVMLPGPGSSEPLVAASPPTVDLRSAPSSSAPWGRPPDRRDDGGPPRVRGEMVWLHKTAPTLVIQGRGDISPEEHAAGRRR